MTNDEPIFPPELEREIFETAAIIHPPSIRTLLLVAKRTLEWQVACLSELSATQAGTIRLEPLQYRIVRIKDPAHVLRIEDIAILRSDTCPQLLPLLSAMPQLRRFAGALCPLFGTAQRLTNDGGGSFLRNITHLDLFDHGSSVMSTIMTLPSLTHLSFSDPTISTPNAFWTSVGEILPRCMHLVVLLLMLPTWAAELRGRGTWANAMPVGDVRLVAGTYTPGEKAWKEWENHALVGAEDFWDRAEDFVRRKRSGEVDALCVWMN
ncbi:hypothetical protein C8F01DRAFT_1254327 [Mycena amicta]|nr:hypothetical protein C8F01DRAFT_1254327 [Mycena amicta]